MFSTKFYQETIMSYGQIYVLSNDCFPWKIGDSKVIIYDICNSALWRYWQDITGFDKTVFHGIFSMYLYFVDILVPDKQHKFVFTPKSLFNNDIRSNEQAIKFLREE